MQSSENSVITSFEEFEKFTKVNSIPSRSFYNCTSLTKICLPLSITTIGYQAFDSCTSLTGDINFPNATGKIDYDTFYNTAITSFVAPNVTSIIGGTGNAGAFVNCKCLKTVSIPSVTSLGGGIFKNCISLEEIDLPSAKTLSYDVFNGCKNLKRVSFGDVITSIDYNTFLSCTLLEYVIVNNPTPPILSDSVFGGSNNTFLIYVPDNSVSIYQVATNWSAYAARIKGISTLILQ